jgi:4-hydroxybenzoate polyprenyltransferase
MSSISIEQLDSLDTPFLIVQLDEVFTNFKIVELNALEFSKQKPIKIFLALLLILMCFSRKIRKLINSNFTSDLIILNVKNIDVLSRLINKLNGNHQLLFTHSGNSTNTKQIIELIDAQLNLDISSIIIAFDDLSSSKQFETMLGGQEYYHVSKYRSNRFIFPRHLKHIKVRSKKQITENLKYVLNEIRIKHWTKNLLVFVPILTAQQIFSYQAWVNSLIYFTSMSLVASGTYVLNDLIDIRFDAIHAQKKKRPLVSGSISIKISIFLMLILVSTGFLISHMFLSTASTASLLTYLIVTVTYSIYLKRVLALDLILLSVLHTLRIIGGSLASDVLLSFWLLSFSIFIFFSMSAIKRTIEIQNSNTALIPGRPYEKEDLLVTYIAGISSGISAVLMFALYVQSPAVVEIYYKSPEILFLAIPVLLFWVYYAWLNTSRKLIQYDPVIWAIRDKGSQVCLSLLLLIGLAAAVIP